MTDKRSIYRALPLLGGRPLVANRPAPYTLLPLVDFTVTPSHFRPYQPRDWGAMQRYTRITAIPFKLWQECNWWDPTFTSDSSQLFNSGSFFYPPSARYTVYG